MRPVTRSQVHFASVPTTQTFNSNSPPVDISKKLNFTSRSSQVCEALHHEANFLSVLNSLALSINRFLLSITDNHLQVLTILEEKVDLESLKYLRKEFQSFKKLNIEQACSFAFSYEEDMTPMIRDFEMSAQTLLYVIENEMSSLEDVHSEETEPEPIYKILCSLKIIKKKLNKLKHEKDFSKKSTALIKIIKRLNYTFSEIDKELRKLSQLTSDKDYYFQYSPFLHERMFLIQAMYYTIYLSFNLIQESLQLETYPLFNSLPAEADSLCTLSKDLYDDYPEVVEEQLLLLERAVKATLDELTSSLTWRPQFMTASSRGALASENLNRALNTIQTHMDARSNESTCDVSSLKNMMEALKV